MNEQSDLSPYHCTTLIATQAIYQTHALAATIFWLSLARLDCYLRGQGFLFLQRETLALLVTQQHMGGLAGGAMVGQAIREQRSRVRLEAGLGG